MSWLFSQALVAEYSRASRSGGAACALWSGNPTPLAYLPPARTKDFSRLSRSGATFALLTDDLGAGLLTWFRGVSLARTSAWPARALASTASAAECGNTWRASLARFDPASRSWRTAQRSLLEDLTECSPTWPRSGMTADGQCWELPTWAPPTSAPAFGSLLPTPCTVDTGSMFNRSASAGAALRPTLGAMARFDLWPTPTVSGNYNRAGLSAKSGDGLATAVKNWPTPNAGDAKQSGNVANWDRRKAEKAAAGINLQEPLAVAAARMWRTPSAMVTEPKSTVTKLSGRKPTDPQVGLADQVGGKLNPTWVEWLMGWPIGWTDLRLSAMDKCPCVQPQPGACSLAA
jgi:hypothetical protein